MTVMLFCIKSYTSRLKGKWVFLELCKATLWVSFYISDHSRTSSYKQKKTPFYATVLIC